MQSDGAAIAQARRESKGGMRQLPSGRWLVWNRLRSTTVPTKQGAFTLAQQWAQQPATTKGDSQ